MDLTEKTISRQKLEGVHLGRNIPVEGTVDAQAVRTGEPIRLEDRKGPLMLKQREEEDGAC